MKYNETGLSPLSEQFWLTIKQLQRIINPIKPYIFKYECKYKSQYSQCVPINIPHRHTIEKDTNRITIVIKTKDI